MHFWNICNNHTVKKIFTYLVILTKLKKLWSTSCVKMHMVTHQDSADESSQKKRRFSASWEVPRDYVCTLKMSQDKHSSRHEEKKSGKICHPVVVMQIQSAPPDVYFSAPLSPMKAWWALREKWKPTSLNLLESSCSQLCPSRGRKYHSDGKQF